MTSKHPCADCHCCQFCSDARCHACRAAAGGREDAPAKLSIREQIDCYNRINRKASAPASGT
ncbi:MAG TPA: hypothetical protein DCE18_20645 [Syntrophobacteraceae bacterium]|nr:hypothetical protein [Syntrophobacteraceae bacterium]